MPLGPTEAFQASTITQISTQQVAITQKSAELIRGVMVDIVSARNNPEKGLPAVRNTAGFQSGIGTNIDYRA